MSDQNRRFFSGNTLQQAIVAAAAHYGVEPDALAYHKVEKRHGFLKVRRRVVIEVDPEHPRRGPGEPVQRTREAPPPPPAPAAPPAERRPPSREPRREAPPRRRERRPPREAVPAAPAAEEATVGDLDLVQLPERPRPLAERYPPASGPLADAAREALNQILKVGGLEAAATVLEGEDRLEIELSGRDNALLVAEDGELLQAIEHLLPRAMRGIAGESTAVRVDCESFHELREERLRSLAQRAASEVRRTGQAKRLPQMNPADRRIVHLTIADEPGVTSESDGDGFLKRVRVEPG